MKLFITVLSLLIIMNITILSASAYEAKCVIGSGINVTISVNNGILRYNNGRTVDTFKHIKSSGYCYENISDNDQQFGHEICLGKFQNDGTFSFNGDGEVYGTCTLIRR